MQLRYVLPVEMITGPYDSADEASIASVSMEIVAGPSIKDDNIIENGVNGDGDGDGDGGICQPQFGF